VNFDSRDDPDLLVIPVLVTGTNSGAKSRYCAILGGRSTGLSSTVILGLDPRIANGRIVRPLAENRDVGARGDPRVEPEDDAKRRMPFSHNALS